MVHNSCSGPVMRQMWTKPHAWVFSGPNHDTGIRSSIPGPIMEWVNRPRVTHVIGSEYSTRSTSDAASPVYDDGANFCSNAVNSDE